MTKELIIKHQRLAQIQAEDAVFYLSLNLLETAKYFQQQAARNAEIAIAEICK